MSPGVSVVFDLSPAEKLQLVEDLWDNLSACPDDVPLHTWQIEELDKTEEEMKKNPDSWMSWDEVKRNARSSNGR